MTRLAVSFCLFIHLGAVAILAQTVSSTTGVINGRVTDSSGAVLPGVTVTLSGAAMMGTPTTITNAEGQYRFLAVPPGEHNLAFELTGFAS